MQQLRIKIIIALIVFPVFSFSQNNKIDSLKNLIESYQDDTSKVIVLNKLCKEYSSNDFTKALEYGNKALILSKKLNQKKEIALSLNAISSVYIYQGKYAEATKNLFEALKINEDFNDKQIKAAILNNIGNVYYYQGKFKKAIEYYLKDLEIEKKLENQSGVAKSLYNIGIIYQEQEENYDEAVKYFKQSLEIFKELNNQRGIAYLYNSLGSVNETIEEYEISLSFYKKALSKFKEIGDKRGIAATKAAIGIVYFRKKAYKKAIDNLDDALVIAKKINTRDILMQIYQVQGEIFSSRGEYKKAFESHKFYSEVKDSLLNEKNQKQMAEFQTKYETEKKEKQIVKQALEIDKKNADIAKQRVQKVAFIGGFVLMLILSIIIFRSYKTKQKSTILLTKQKHEIEENLKYTKKLQEALKNDLSHYMQISLRKLMNPHFIFNSLNSIQSFILQNDKLAASIYLSKFSELIRNVLEHAQHEYISLKEELDTLALYVELEEKRFEDKFTSLINSEPGIVLEQYLVPPLIFQPFVENAILHGLMHKEEEEGKLIINIKKENNSLICSVEDNGVGRDKAKEINKNKRKHKSFGIKATNQRLKIVNSLNNTDVFVNYFDLKSASGKSLGTKVEFILPCLLNTENTHNV